jgi:hypothetical protein
MTVARTLAGGPKQSVTVPISENTSCTDPLAPSGEAESSRGLAGHVRGNLVSYLALFVAVGRTSFAARRVLLPENSVGTQQVMGT